jgi:hypothetical protein
MDMKRIIVELIAKNDGKWTWYQLERGLNSRGLGGHANTIAELEGLIESGLVGTKTDPSYPAPLYTVTEKGRLFLASN